MSELRIQFIQLPSSQPEPIVPRRTIFLRLGMVLDAILSFATFVEQSRRNGSKKTAERKQPCAHAIICKYISTIYLKFHTANFSKPSRQGCSRSFSMIEFTIRLIQSIANKPDQCKTPKHFNSFFVKIVADGKRHLKLIKACFKKNNYYHSILRDCLFAQQEQSKLKYTFFEQRVKIDLIILYNYTLKQEKRIQIPLLVYYARRHQNYSGTNSWFESKPQIVIDVKTTR